MYIVQLTKHAYSELKNVYNLFTGLWSLQSALHNHCRADILQKNNNDNLVCNKNTA